MTASKQQEKDPSLQEPEKGQEEQNLRWAQGDELARTLVGSQLWQRKTRTQRMRASKKNSSAEASSYYLLMQEVAMSAGRKVFITLTADPHWKWPPLSALTLSAQGVGDGGMTLMTLTGEEAQYITMWYHFSFLKFSSFLKELWKAREEPCQEIGIMHLDKSAKIALSKKLDFNNLSSEYLNFGTFSSWNRSICLCWICLYNLALVQWLGTEAVQIWSRW